MDMPDGIAFIACPKEGCTFISRGGIPRTQQLAMKCGKGNESALVRVMRGQGGYKPSSNDIRYHQRMNMALMEMEKCMEEVDKVGVMWIH